MEKEKTESRIQISHTQQALQKILQVDTVPASLVVTVELLREKNFKSLSDGMPTTVEKAVDYGVPMASIQKAAEKELIAFIEFELIKLSSMVNIDARLNLQRHQVPLIAQGLYDEFKHESMQDISLCLRRGALGKYSPEGIFRLDGAVISGWMGKYLEEKYTVVEANMTKVKQKETELKRESNGKSIIDLYKAVVGDELPKDDNNSSNNAYERWKLENPRTETGATMLEHRKKIERARRLNYLEKNPDANEEEVKAYIEKFNAI